MPPSLQETEVLPTHKNIRESEKIVGKGYTDVFRWVRPYVGKTESGEASPTREQHSVGNASPDVVFPDDVDGVKNTSLDTLFGDETVGVENASPDVIFINSYGSV
ncbi:hypothetical protein E5676_scaffold85G00030 [Cucumis melo var. makuwa]|uniref:Uncharacterized protein n=1 Tax=Cucumis melo var. makuwa TaxID=1194695 RepID=A0A5A7T5J5_CUCMM|nr:hypothetical protein E6C27_scaffold278G001280 [Cucumis melo var. makuwa]TYJ97498.1 hypothetical protein E5676_scaffold85G00030 [Cucumis melo var. makuwa]